MVTFPLTLTDPYPGFQGHEIFEVEYLCLNDKVSTEHWVTIPNLVPLSMILSDL